MSSTLPTRVALRTVPLALAAALVVWRLSIDWTHSTPREIRDVIQFGLLFALPWQFIDLVPSENRIGLRLALRRSPSWVGGAIAASLACMFIYNGVTAYGNLRCAEGVRSLKPAVASQSRLAEMECFR